MPNASAVCILLVLCGIWNNRNTAVNKNYLSVASRGDSIELFYISCRHSEELQLQYESSSEK